MKVISMRDGQDQLAQEHKMQAIKLWIYIVLFFASWFLLSPFVAIGLWLFVMLAALVQVGVTAAVRAKHLLRR